jgi:hypothetical protein
VDQYLVIPLRPYTPLARDVYPVARPTRGVQPPPVLDLYDRYEVMTGATTLGDTDAEVGRFAGTPDSIVLTASANGALVTLRQRGREGRTAIRVLAGETVETHVAADVVVARNAVALSNAVLSVVGKWAARPAPPPEAGAVVER